MICHADKYFLRRFLRARQHDLKRAKEMYATSIKWRAEFGTDTILEDFHFHERDAFISLYPQGYHKTDKMVSSYLLCQASHWLLAGQSGNIGCRGHMMMSCTDLP